MLAGNYFSIFLRVVKTSERPENANLDSMAGPHPELSWRILTRFWAFLNIASNFLGLSQMIIMITILFPVEIAIISIHIPLVGQTHSIPMKFFCHISQDIPWTTCGTASGRLAVPADTGLAHWLVDRGLHSRLVIGK
jgi:hypothetical protein